MKKWNKLAVGVVAAAALALSACASPSSGPDASEGPKPTVLKVALATEVSSATPQLGSFGSDYTQLYPVYDRLIHFDP